MKNENKIRWRFVIHHNILLANDICLDAYWYALEAFGFDISKIREYRGKYETIWMLWLAEDDAKVIYKDFVAAAKEDDDLGWGGVEQQGAIPHTTISYMRERYKQ